MILDHDRAAAQIRLVTPAISRYHGPCRIGPMIKSEETGLTCAKHGWIQVLRRFRDSLSLTTALTVMDTRAGVLTEPEKTPVAPFDWCDAGQHLQIATTDRFACRRSEEIAKLVKLRNR
ncbi:hypothetical protein [Pseudooceanicola marinus]|uniref:hypothetical protein n=1 Tax=Pseudooceanicola marinus TaxID=396013 RepID=UPI001CD404EB|nr:hypothetical protein [Pseudooceanicola marinus]MCA1334646.1 hypothetical protein [Pseudooceanicola marinus]